MPALSGCTFHASFGPTLSIPKSDLEAGVHRVLVRRDMDPRSIECDGDLVGKVGRKQTCTAFLGNGSTLPVVCTTTQVDGDDIKYDIERAEPTNVNT